MDLRRLYRRAILSHTVSRIQLSLAAMTREAARAPLDLNTGQIDVWACVVAGERAEQPGDHYPINASYKQTVKNLL